jgi:hypothetical protein
MIRTGKCTRVVLLFVALVAMSSDAHAKKGNPGILPPNSHFRGLSYGQWAAEWWKTVFDIPVVDGDHPLISGGAFPGPKGMLFLAGVFADPDEPAVIELTIPAGTPLFFPVINAECSVFEPDPFHGDDEDELRDCANEHIDNTSGRFAVIDGRPVNLTGHRFESPLFTWRPLPEDNIFGAPAGTTSPAVDAGVYLLLAPLSVGEHVIEFGGTFDEFGASINTVYLITVVPRD